MSDCSCGAEAACCGSDEVIAVSTRLSAGDYFGACKVRFGIGRMNYKVLPGLYGLGNPDENAPVLVSANYKLTFDTLRKNLSGLSCWLLILDTDGVNVWCAAGKGTFGTEELLRRIVLTGLADVVAHRRLILPQLGAPGVNGSAVKKQSGFSVTFGPVQAKDIKGFISAGYEATAEMRQVRFTLGSRLILTPIETVLAAKVALLVFGLMFLFNLFVGQAFGFQDFVAYGGAVLCGTVVTPALLPLVPVSAFSGKGWLLGLLWTVLLLWHFGWIPPASPAPAVWLPAAGYLLLLPAVSAWYAMNFTGASTYTSPSGVVKEMRIALPFLIGSLAVGAILLLVGKVMINIG